MHRPRPFLRTHRPLPPRRPYLRVRAAGHSKCSYPWCNYPGCDCVVIKAPAGSRTHAAGVAAVERDLLPRPLAEEVARLTRRGFARELFAIKAVGA